MNPLDYSFWGRAQEHVYKAKPKTVAELKDCVNEFAASLSVQDVRKMTNNIVKRAKFCIAEGGAHFQHKLKKWNLFLCDLLFNCWPMKLINWLCNHLAMVSFVFSRWKRFKVYQIVKRHSVSMPFWYKINRKIFLRNISQMAQPSVK